MARHGRLVLGIARRIAGRREEAEDIAQETFLRVYRTLDRVDPARPFEPWLVRIVVNLARSAVARRPERREEEFEEAAAHQGNDDPSSGLANAQLRDALRLAAGTLADRERDVFLLRDLAGVEVGTIAEALGISEVTVRRQSCDARRKVAAWLRQHRPELI